ncbi:hypothetical protein BJX70DRAFT_122894 [Aspergillus crustosus]
MSRFLHSQEHHGPTTLARFQLAKFSYSTVSINHRGPLPWSHIFGNGEIIAVFEKYATSMSGRIVFKVSRNDQEKLICITDLMKDFDSQIQIRKDDTNRQGFAVVVKLPCLAVKYPQGNGQIRRIQVKFSSHRDFYAALAVLSDINCPFSESDVSSTQPIRRSFSSLSSFGHIGLDSGAKTSSSTASWPSRSSIASSETCRPSTLLDVLPNTASTPSYVERYQINGSLDRLNDSLCATLQSSPSTSTICGSSGRADSITLDKPSRLSVRPVLPKPDIMTVENKPAAERLMGTNTFTGYHDIHDPDMPPRRDLPFRTPGTKRSHPSSKAETDTGMPITLTDASECVKEAPPTKIIKRNTRNPAELEVIPPSSSTSLMHGATAELASLFSLTPADLTQYISNPTKERTLKLEDLICTHIKDDNFVQLCVDVESVWRRFALGK